MSDDELVRRYLLGDLPGDEEEALETRLLIEDDLHDLAEAMEAEVLEEFARGELNPSQRERVARYLGASEEGRLRLAVVQGLAATPAPVGRVLPFRPVLPTSDKLRAIAAMLVMAVGALWLSLIQARIHEQPPLRPHPEETASLLTPTPVPTPPPINTFVAMIALSNLRGIDQIQSFDIPARTDEVELRLTLPIGEEGYPSYRIVLSDASEQEVKKSEGLLVNRSSRQLALRMDADQLPFGRYTLTVQGVTSEGEVEDLAFPEFEVQEP